MRDPALMDPAAPRGATMDVTMTDGRAVSHNTHFPPGMKENSLITEDVDTKACDLMTPVLGRNKTEALIKQIDTLEHVANKRQLRPFYTA